MVAPWRARYMGELLNLRRLQRIASDLAVDLRLVARGSKTRNLAREAGLATAYGLPAALRSHRPVEIRSTDLGKRVVPADVQLSRRHQRPPPRYNLGRGILGLVFVGLLLAMLLGVVGFFLPTAQVTLSPVSTREVVAFAAKANTRYRTVDAEQALIPLRSVQVIVEGRAQTPASGTADVAEGYATGSVVFTNRTNQAVVVPKGTVVRSGSGGTTRFQTTSEVTLPAAMFGTQQAPVEATEPGYVNAGSYTVNRVEGALASRVEVMNDSPITGGGSRRVPIVVYADLDTLRGMLVEQLQTEAYVQLVQQLGADEFVPASSIHVEVMSLDYDQYVPQQSEILSGGMKLAVRGSAVSVADLRELARARLIEAGGGNVDLIDDSLELDHSDDARIQDTWVEVDVRAAASVVPTFDAEAVRGKIRGRTVEQALDWLANNLALQSPPRIDIEPEGWPRLPVLSGRLDIVLSSLP
ncbi:MAG: hypothetical protein R6X16_16655 [Anaerolineae bacterium]